ncbi:folate-binding protein YgfZ [Mesorhizobium microcysteis]|uniref:Folate-binding protein YgfZ n=1 Tax=Neoaquamicrobium microcysteis TaxID=2682781 RepID=A0A5D4GX00_9HYPH|nr:folate-binding protein YgfZ [Mesorhizobium microcysteis]TYR32777.1 folate-binding protein YgfZ [Mesorhizobium microcysteis]
MPTLQLADRTVIQISGADAEHFLQNLLTTDLDQLAPGEVKPGALLTPQGKILFDFLISRDANADFRLDCRADVAEDFRRRLMLYKLRAKVEISSPDQALVSVSWDDDSGSSQSDSPAAENDSGWLADRRFPADAGVCRRYGASGPHLPADTWTHLRIAHGIAESGSDYALSDAFPHDVLLDETGGVGFKKGCYVGQEVVSRMQHRGTARRRVMIVKGAQDLPATGTDIRANDRAIGSLGSAVGLDGVAIVRIDRVKDALDAGQEITAGDVPVTLSIPGWAVYKLPEDKSGTEQE